MMWVAVALGGLAGTLARYAVNLAFVRLTPRPEPYATATVNLLGSVAIGALAGAIAGGRVTMTMPVRAFVFVGVLGGFTTFSSLMLDTLTLVEGGTGGAAFANVLAQTIAGFLATYLAYRAFS